MTTTTMADPEIKVRNLANPDEFTTWRISQNLTDRWGGINDAFAENKPLAELEGTPGLLDRLRGQMVDEITFVVRKDGKFGLLFELEFWTKESEATTGVTDLPDLSPQAEVLSELVRAVKKLQQEFPAVEWAIPSESEVINDRLAIWGFFPDGALSEEQRVDVSTALYGLNLSQDESEQTAPAPMEA